MNTVVVSYIPAPHAGYLKLLRQYKGSVLYVLGEEFIAELAPLRKHLPGVMPGEAACMVESLGIFASVHVLSKQDLPLLRRYPRVVMPDEDVSHTFAATYLAGVPVEFDGGWRLRWDWGASQKNTRPAGGVVSTNELDRDLMARAKLAAERSSDWWRQVGALLAKDGKPLVVAYNKHVPSEHTAYLLGDPRSNFEQGVSIEVSVASHAERRVQAIAAREGIATKGCDLYVSTFPCPPCAYAWAESGLRRLYYADGYSNLEGENALAASGIEIIRVEMQLAPAPT